MLEYEKSKFLKGTMRKLVRKSKPLEKDSYFASLEGFLQFAITHQQIIIKELQDYGNQFLSTIYIQDSYKKEVDNMTAETIALVNEIAKAAEFLLEFLGGDSQGDPTDYKKYLRDLVSKLNKQQMDMAARKIEIEDECLGSREIPSLPAMRTRSGTSVTMICKFTSQMGGHCEVDTGKHPVKVHLLGDKIALSSDLGDARLAGQFKQVFDRHLSHKSIPPTRKIEKALQKGDAKLLAN